MDHSELTPNSNLPLDTAKVFSAKTKRSVFAAPTHYTVYGGGRNDFNAGT